MAPRALTVVVVATLLLAACTGTGEQGSGVEASEQRDVAPFTRIAMSAEADVVVAVGGAHAVTVRGDDNLLAELSTEVDDGTLTIEEDADLDPEAGLTVDITMPALDQLELDGAGDATIEGVAGESLRIEVSGAGDVEASGEVDRVEVVISGAGDVQTDDLLAREAEVEISGAGSVHVRASESLHATVSGAGDVVYSGDPANVVSEVSGAGEITPESG